MIARSQVLKLFLGLCLLGILGRLLFLQFSERHFLRNIAESAYTRQEKVAVLRGVITDRQGTPIAVSTPMYDVWINPRHFDFKRTDFAEATRILELNHDQQLEILKSKKEAYFIYIKRQVSPELWLQVKALGIPGIYADLNQKRFYPDGEINAQIVGFVNIDGKGQEGIELQYDDWLSGQAGIATVKKDLKGRAIAPATVTTQSEMAKSVALSIDRRIQFLVYQSLAEGVKKHSADAGSAIVLDIQTGEILALANYPSFNPNNRDSMKPGDSRNRAITDTFEPGSVIKTFTALAGLQEGKFKLTDEIDTSPGYVKIGRNIVRDDENNGKITLEQVLQKSSNVGISYVVTHISPDGLPNLLRDLGFGRSANVHFPGEAIGMIPSRKEWPPFELSTMSFGYGITASLLQLTQAYAVLGTGGLLRQPTLLRVDQPMPAHRVANEEYTKQILQALTSVVAKGGTAAGKGALDNYQVSGKTGTAKKAIAGGYAARSYRSFFIGLAPLTNPRVVMAVMIDEPRGKFYYGGDVAAPIFKDSLAQILPLLNVEPDRTSEKPKKHQRK